MRASRFRWEAPCLAWTHRDGSKALAKYILSVIPSSCARDNSTKAFGRLFTKQEQEKAREANKGILPDRRRKAKRAAEAAQTEEVADDDSADDGNSSVDDEETLLLLDKDNSEDEAAGPSMKRRRVISLLSDDETLGRSGSEEEQPSRPISKRVKKGLVEQAEDEVPVQHSGKTPKLRPADTEFVNSTPPQDTTNLDPLGLSYLVDSSSSDERSLAPSGSQRSHRPKPGASAKGKQTRDRLQKEARHTLAIRPTRVKSSRVGKQTWMSGAGRLEEAHRNAQQTKPMTQSDEQTDSTPKGETSMYDRSITSSHFTKQTSSPVQDSAISSIAEQGCDPKDDTTFQIERYAGISNGDYRYIAPTGPGTGPEDILAIRNALRLTEVDYFQQLLQQTGTPSLPSLDPTGKRQLECYATQCYRIQKAFSHVWPGPQPAPMLYRLPAWKSGFENWQVPDERGRLLWALSQGLS